MKINQKSIRFLAIQLLEKLNQLSRDEAWDIFVSCLDMISEVTFSAIEDTILKTMIEEDTVLNYKRDVYSEVIFGCTLIYKYKRRIGNHAIECAFFSEKNIEKKEAIIQMVLEDLKSQIDEEIDTVQVRWSKLRTKYKISITEMKYLGIVYAKTSNKGCNFELAVNLNRDFIETVTGCSYTESMELACISKKHTLARKGIIDFDAFDEPILTKKILSFIEEN